MDFRNDNEKEDTDSARAPWWQPGLMFFGSITGWIIAPLLISLFLGSWLDKKFNSDPWLSIILLVLAFVVSFVSIYKETKLYIKKLEKKVQDEKNRKPRA